MPSRGRILIRTHAFKSETRDFACFSDKSMIPAGDKKLQ